MSGDAVPPDVDLSRILRDLARAPVLDEALLDRARDVRHLLTDLPTRLAEGQRKAVEGIAHGLTLEQVGEIHGIGAETVRSHYRYALERARVRGRRELVAESIRRGYINPVLPGRIGRGHLDDRQVEALRRLSHGGTLVEVAAAMSYSKETLRVWLAGAREVLGTRNVCHSVAVAVSLGLTEDDD